MAAGHSKGTAGASRRKEGMTSSHHGPYARGCTRPTMGGTAGCEAARRSQSLKTAPSSDRRLQLASVKLESLVIADKYAAVNTFPALVHTARHAMGAGDIRSHPYQPLREGGAEDGPGDWGEVVTR